MARISLMGEKAKAGRGGEQKQTKETKQGGTEPMMNRKGWPQKDTKSTKEGKGQSATDGTDFTDGGKGKSRTGRRTEANEGNEARKAEGEKTALHVCPANIARMTCLSKNEVAKQRIYLWRN
jgi:hypothetical protein